MSSFTFTNNCVFISTRTCSTASNNFLIRILPSHLSPFPSFISHSQQSIIQAYNDKLNSSALPSGWLQREIAREEAEKFGEKTTSSNPKPLTAEQKRELYGEDGDEEGGDGNSDYSDTDDLIRQLEEEIESSSHLSQQQRSVHLASLAARAQRAIDTTFNNRPRFGSLQHLVAFCHTKIDCFNTISFLTPLLSPLLLSRV